MKCKQYILKKGYTLSCSDDTTLIIPIARENSGYLFELDNSAKLIVSLLKKKSSIDQIVKKLSSPYPPKEHKRIRKYTDQFIQKLVKLKIVSEINS
jgi:hypothetical protein